MKSAVLWVLLTLATQTALAQAGIERQSPKDFLIDLPGVWQGRAVQTPVGPLPYDIGFVKQANNCVSGVVKNRSSTHTWTFCVRDQRLRLRFLSDFGGNSTPIRFRQTNESSGVRTFYADTHPFMQVLVSIHGDDGWIKVMHHGGLHVEIRLFREDPKHPNTAG